MPTVEVLIGMIGSGKSTYARGRARDGALIISHDDLTAMLHAEYRYEPGLRECYRRMEESLAWAALTAGRDLVIDRTHLTRESRRRWVTWAPTYGPTAPVIAVLFPRFNAEWHARRRFRADPRGRTLDDWVKVARHHEEQADAEPLDWEAEGFSRRLVITPETSP
jgi:predicted kinase